MLRIRLVCVGKIKERYLRDGIAEYQKRLTKYCKLEIIEITEEALGDNPTSAERQIAVDKEGERLISKLGVSYCILLDLHGNMLKSEQLADRLAELMVGGTSEIAFVIGGTYGVSEQLRKRADYCWSLSELTFTHQMIRMLLLEQLYRGYKIMKNEKYHW